MTESNVISVVANLLRPVSKDVLKGKEKLCLSTVYLSKLNKAFDENVPEDLTSSFHLTEAKASMQIDLQFLFDLVKGTEALKITPDLVENEESKVVSLRRFQNLKILEIHKINVTDILGIQKLRSHIEELTCMYNLQNLSDILDKCGGDFSHKYNWSELKRLNFSHNLIREIDNSFESTPWLQILDLSHNHIANLDFIDHLPNLKRLNLSYNKLEKVPIFKGQICKRLQVFLLNNNFIEDISGLFTLLDLHLLDLSQNCLIDHTSLLSISHMASLYSLDLRGNPINFHPVHRTLTCNYLNKNTATLNFVLDNIPLNRTEKSLSGSLYPLSQNSLGANRAYSSLNSLESSTQERQIRVRNVTIQDIKIAKFVNENEKATVITPSPRSSDRGHLDVKNKIEQLRQEYGEKWMSQESGEILQGVLKFPETSRTMTSTPMGDKLEPSPSPGNISDKSVNPRNPNPFVCAPDLLTSDGDTTTETFVTYTLKPGSLHDDDEEEDDDHYVSGDNDNESSSEPPSDDDDLVDGEKFVGDTVPDSIDLCIVVTDTHLSERDSITTKEKARWHINVVKSCKLGEQPNEVKLEFDTLRSDRISRTYYLEEADSFVKLVLERMETNKVPEIRIEYLCMKCNNEFSRTKKNTSIFIEDKIVCPKCESNLVIETK